MHFAEKTSRPLRDDGLDGVRHVLGDERFRRILWAAARKLSGHAPWTNHADANAMIAKILGHAAAQAHNAPFRRAIDPAARKGVFSGEGTDIDDVALP